MRTQSWFVSCLLLCFGCQTARGGDLGSSTPSFPDAWCGTWIGEAVGGGVPPTMRFRMELQIAPTDDPRRYVWRLVYGEGTQRQVREYALVVRDAEHGDFAIDENDGIVLEAKYVDGVLWSHFTVQDSRIVTRHALRVGAEGSRLEVEMATTREGDGVETGGGAVKTWRVPSVQRALLHPSNLGS